MYYSRPLHYIYGNWNGQLRPKIRLESIIRHNIAQEAQIVQKQCKRSKNNNRTNKTKI